MKRFFGVYQGLPNEIYALFWARIVESMGSFITPLITLILTQKIGMSISHAGTITSIFVISRAPALILGGKLADSVSRKKIIVFSNLASAVFYFLCSFTSSQHFFIWLLMLAADALIVCQPSMEALIADLTPLSQRRQAYSLLYFGLNIGMTICPLLGGILFNYHLHLLFILNSAAIILCAGIIWKFISTDKYPSPDKESSAEIKSSSSLFQVLKSTPVLLFFIMLLFIFDFCYSQWGFMLPTQCSNLFKSNGAKSYSLMTSLNALVVILFTPMFTQFSKKFHPLLIVAFSSFLYMIGYIGFGISSSLVSFLIFNIIFTFGEITQTIQLLAFISDHSPKIFLGRISAFSNFVRGTAQALGPAVMGIVLDRIGYLDSWILIAGLIAAAGIGMLFLNRLEKNTSGLITD